VAFVDPAPAIARRVDALLGPARGAHGLQRPFPILFTSGRPPSPALRAALLRRGLELAATRGTGIPALSAGSD
jgi:glutamate racemase